MRFKKVLIVFSLIVCVVFVVIAYQYFLHLIRLLTFTEKDWELRKLKTLVSKVEKPRSIDINYFSNSLKEKNTRIKYYAVKGLSNFINAEIQNKFIEILESDNDHDNDSNYSLLSFTAYCLAKKYPDEKTEDTFKKMVYALPDTTYKYLLGCFYMYILTGQEDYLYEIDRIVTESHPDDTKLYIQWLKEFGNENLIPVIDKNFDGNQNELNEIVSYIKTKHSKLWKDFKTGIN